MDRRESGRCPNRKLQPRRQGKGEVGKKSSSQWSTNTWDSVKRKQIFHGFPERKAGPAVIHGWRVCAGLDCWDLPNKWTPGPKELCRSLAFETLSGYSWWTVLHVSEHLENMESGSPLCKIVASAVRRSPGCSFWEPGGCQATYLVANLPTQDLLLEGLRDLNLNIRKDCKEESYLESKTDLSSYLAWYLQEWPRRLQMW